MRLTVEVPAWMIADGEFEDLVVGRRLEVGFALIPSSWTPGSGGRGLRQPDGSSRTMMSGIVVWSSRDVPPVLDDGAVFPILAVAETTPAAGTEIDVEGRLLVEPFLWAADGMLWPQVPDGVHLWQVVGMSASTGAGSTAIDALPTGENVDHAATYLLELDRREPSDLGPVVASHP